MKHAPQTPENHRIYAVGDIHGRVDLLSRLLAMIEADAVKYKKRKKKLIFLGDYIDRGLDSRGVIERLLGNFAADLQPIFIRGNHDDRLMQFMAGHLEVAPAWLALGGAAALASYGVNSFGGVDNEHKLETMLKSLLSKVPAAHVEFFENTVISATYGDYYFVHAGVRPSVPLNKQDPMDQMTIRGDFLFSEEAFGKVVVHGHTIRPEPEIKHNRIGIDTGAFATGRLTCLVLDKAQQSFLST